MKSATVPDELRSERLLMRPWRSDDAVALLPILEADAEHLGSWIPAHVAAPVPLPELTERLAGFAADFAADQCWRYAIFSPDQHDLLGEISLFPRSACGRTRFALADRLEIGYFLRKGVTGRGYATEASRAMLSLASALPGIRHVEIHCDPRNEPSAAIPRRLGFQLLVPGVESPAYGQAPPGGMVWVKPLALSATANV